MVFAQSSSPPERASVPSGLHNSQQTTRRRHSLKRQNFPCTAMTNGMASAAAQQEARACWAAEKTGTRRRQPAGRRPATLQVKEHVYGECTSTVGTSTG